MDPLIPAEIKAFRQAVGGISQVRLAEELGVSRRVVEDWEAGRSTPPAYARLAFAALNGRLEPWGAPDVLLGQLRSDRVDIIGHLQSLEGGGIYAGQNLEALDAQLIDLRRKLSITEAAIARIEGVQDTRFEVGPDGQYRAWVGGNPLVRRDGSELSFRTIAKAVEAIQIATNDRFRPGA